jgi:hypothetical protein
MRRFLLPFALLAALALPALAAALERPTGDGTLSVKDAKGVVTITVRGAFVGRVESGYVRIQDVNPDDGPGPLCWGAEARNDVSDTTTAYIGNDLRFRSTGGSVRVRIRGVGIHLSVVGRGSVTLDGEGTPDDGLFSLNGDDFRSLPDKPTTLQLQPPRADSGGERP